MASSQMNDFQWSHRLGEIDSDLERWMGLWIGYATIGDFMATPELHNAASIAML
jgi:hypothetical protein